MRVSRATELVLLAFLLGLAGWVAFSGALERAERYDGTTVLLTFLLIGALLIINRSGRPNEQALVSVLVTMTVIWVLARIVVFLTIDHSLKWDHVHFSRVGDLNTTVLFVVLGTVGTAFGIRIGSALWAALHPGAPAFARLREGGEMRFPMRDLLKFGYIVAAEIVIFRYAYALVAYEAGAIPFLSRAIDVVLNHDIAFLWILSYAVWHWSELPRRDKIRVYVFLLVLVFAFTSKNFLFQLTLLYFFAMLSWHDDPIVTRRVMAVVALSALLFVPLYVLGYQAMQVEKAAGVFGQRFGLVSILDSVNQMRKEGLDLEDLVVSRGVVGLTQFGARFDSLVALLSFEPKYDYMTASYGVKRLVNMVVPRVRLFPDAFLPQSEAFYVAYEVHTLEEMQAAYSTEALPGLGLYYTYFGPIGALVAMFLTGVVMSCLYRKAVAVRGFFAPVAAVYCLYFFSQALYGMGIDSVIGAFLYNGLTTGATFYGFLWLLRLVRNSRARRIPVAASPVPGAGMATE